MGENEASADVIKTAFKGLLNLVGGNTATGKKREVGSAAMGRNLNQLLFRAGKEMGDN